MDALNCEIMSSGIRRLFSDEENPFLSKSAEHPIVAKDADVARQRLPWMHLCAAVAVGALLPTLVCVLCWLDARALRADVTRTRIAYHAEMTSRCGGYVTSSVEDGDASSNDDVVDGRQMSVQRQVETLTEVEVKQEVLEFLGHVQVSQHLSARTRSKRKADQGEGELGRNGRRTSVRPSTARRHQTQQKPIFAAIHLSLYIDELSPADQDSIRLHNATVNINFGRMNNKGFIPTQDNDLEGQPIVYRSWRVADWFNKTHSQTTLAYDPLHGTVTVNEMGLYHIYGQIRFHHRRYCGFAVMVNDEVRIECLDGRDPMESNPAHWHYTTCHAAAVTWLLAGDRVWLRDAHGSMSEMMEHFVDVIASQSHAASFWGLVRIA